MGLKNKKHERAALLLSEDKLTDQQIAETVGVTLRTIARWKLKEPFLARVDELTQAWADRALEHGLARRSRRLEVLSDLHSKLLLIIEKRGQDPELAGLWNGAGATGLVVKTFKGIGKDEQYREVEVREVDTGIVKEIRCLLEQIAQEAGQHVTQVNVTIGLADQIREARERVTTARNSRLLAQPAQSNVPQ